eukprot:g14886.t1
MTILEELQAELQRRIDARNEAHAEMRKITTAVEERGDSKLTADEQTKFDEARGRLGVLELEDETNERYADSIHATRTRVTELEEMEEREKRIAKETPDPVKRDTKVTGEKRTYTAEAERFDNRSFLRDVYSAQVRADWGAAQRLEQHMQEERTERRVAMEGVEARDVDTGAFGGFVVPQYLVDLAVPIIRPGRPFADICNGHTLPAEGMTMILPRQETGVSVASQDGEGTGVSETDGDWDDDLSIPVRTIAGKQDVSRQSIERGRGTDELVIQDLVNAHDAELDRQCLLGSGASGEHLGVFNTVGNVGVTYTDASPTAEEMFPKLADLIQQIQSGSISGLTHFVFHPRRWWWLVSNLTANHPMLTIPNANARAVGTAGETGYAAQGAGILGADVVLDRNVQTTNNTDQDVVYGVDASECHLWEDPGAPMLVRAEQSRISTLQVEFVLYSYSATDMSRVDKERAALLRELRAYETQNMEDRAEQVREQLEALGAPPESDDAGEATLAKLVEVTGLDAVELVAQIEELNDEDVAALRGLDDDQLVALAALDEDERAALSEMSKPEQPTRGDSRDKWVAYVVATHEDITEETLTSMGRDEIRDEYGEFDE